MTPDAFKAYETVAVAKGFLVISASPLTRSSHHAGEDFQRLRAGFGASAPRNPLRPRPGDAICRDTGLSSRAVMWSRSKQGLKRLVAPSDALPRGSEPSSAIP